MEQFLQKLDHGLDQCSRRADFNGIGVAFSGGLDSTLLLAALARSERRSRVRALHINHGLHPESESWVEHCSQTAAKFGIAFNSRSIDITKTAGQSLEAVARQARYAMLAELMEPGELLLTAHHRDDQLETVLLRLLRGSGVKGLRGISPNMPFGPGYLARPMLEISKDEIRNCAGLWGLNWIEDSSNRDQSFDRNYLRSEVIPQLQQRWPGVAITAGRAARQMAAAQELLDFAAVIDSSKVESPARVSQAYLRGLSQSRRGNLLRYLIGGLGLSVPNAAQLNQLISALDVTRPDAQTQVQWPGGEGRIFRGQLYLFEPLTTASAPGYEGRLEISKPWQGPEGRLELSQADGVGLSEAWVAKGLTVRFRTGGERFKPLDSAHSRKLKKWLQLAGIVPWMRQRIPLLYCDSMLVAVGDLWLSDEACKAGTNGPSWQVTWTDHPSID